MAAILRDSVAVVVVPTRSMSNTASHDNHEKINSWVSFTFLYGYGALLGNPLGRRSSTINLPSSYNPKAKLMGLGQSIFGNAVCVC